MLLCLDIGNTHIVGGLFDKNKIVMKFRHHSVTTMSSDEFGLFLMGILREHRLSPNDITAISMSSVVGELNYTIRAACLKYLKVSPFIADYTMKSGLSFAYHQPKECGVDRIIAAMAANALFPSTHKIIVNFGTATCICAVNQDNRHLGGLIFPGVRTAHDAVVNKTANLTAIEIHAPNTLLGLSTKEGLQSGLYWSQLGATKEIIQQIKSDIFPNEAVIVLGTGGMSHLFAESGVFTHIEPDLVLIGLKTAYSLNQ